MPYDWRTVFVNVPIGTTQVLPANPGRVAILTNGLFGTVNTFLLLGENGQYGRLRANEIGPIALLSVNDYGEALRQAIFVECTAALTGLLVIETYDTLPCAYAADISCQCPNYQAHSLLPAPTSGWQEWIRPRPERTLLYIFALSNTTVQNGWYWQQTTIGFPNEMFYSVQSVELVLRLCDFGPIIQQGVWILEATAAPTFWHAIEVWYD